MASDTGDWKNLSEKGNDLVAMVERYRRGLQRKAEARAHSWADGAFEVLADAVTPNN